MEDLSLHVLDIVENSIRCGASAVTIELREIGAAASAAHRLVLVIEDNGEGMSDEEIEKSLDPFYTTKPEKRVGLGLPLLRQAAAESGGGMTVESTPGRGTRIRAEFGLDHPDMKPLGDIEGTVSLLKVFHREVTFTLDMEIQGIIQSGRLR